MGSFTHDLCRAHTPRIRDQTEFEEVPAGWHLLVTDLMVRLTAALGDAPDTVLVIKQIKQKAGSLRFHFALDPEPCPQDATWHAIRTLVDEAVQTSISTCDVCGSPGELRSGRRWSAVRCRQHTQTSMQPT